MKVPNKESLKKALLKGVVPPVTCRAHCIQYYDGKWYNDLLDSGVMSTNPFFFKVNPRFDKMHNYLGYPSISEVYKEITESIEKI